MAENENEVIQEAQLLAHQIAEQEEGGRISSQQAMEEQLAVLGAEFNSEMKKIAIERRTKLASFPVFNFEKGAANICNALSFQLGLINSKLAVLEPEQREEFLLAIEKRIDEYLISELSEDSNLRELPEVANLFALAKKTEEEVPWSKRANEIVANFARDTYSGKTVIANNTRINNL